MDHTRIARAFLGLNAGFSLLLGLGLLIFARAAAEMLFAEPAAWQSPLLRLLGAGLLVFAIELSLMATDRFVTRAQVMAISAMDVVWIVGSGVLLTDYGQMFSAAGQGMVVAVAFVVTVCAAGQSLGARQIRPGLSRASVIARGGTVVAQVSRAVDAPRDVVWRVMTDHPGYADVADNLSRVEVVGGEGLGMQRRCYGPKGENWLETCDLFDRGRAYGFRIHTEATDYPYPISDLRGKWSVKPLGSGSEFEIRIEAAPKGNWVVRTLFKAAAKRQFRMVLADLADGWAARMEREARARPAA